MNPLDPGRGVFSQNDLRRLFDALELARPDLSESLNVIRVAVGLQSEHTARYNGAGEPQVIDAQWRRTR